jgi:hypothetical protein
MKRDRECERERERDRPCRDIQVKCKEQETKGKGGKESDTLRKPNTCQFHKQIYDPLCVLIVNTTNFQEKNSLV